MEKISAALLNLLLNASWQIAVIAVAAEISTRLLRGWSARERHRVWVAALLLSIGLPLLQAARPAALQFKPRTVPAKSDAVATPVIAIQDDVASKELPGSTSTPANKTTAVPQRVAILLVGLYFTIVSLRGMALVRAWWSTRRLLQSAGEVEVSGTLERVLSRCLEQTSIGTVRVVASGEVASPITLGVAPAVVVLPEKLLQETDESILMTAIGHELVHIDRHDFVLNFIYRLMLVPLSFHPAAWLIERRIEQTRELRCDEVVTERLLSPTAYARSLVELAGQAMRSPAATMAVGIADADILEERIMFMLKKPKLSGAKRALSLSAAALVFAIPCIAAAPYAMHVNVQQTEAAVTTPIVTPNFTYTAINEQAAQSTPEQQKSEKPRSADFEKGRTAGMLYAARGFAYAADGQEKGQAEQEVRARQKLEESQLSPEEREKRMIVMQKELAARAKFYAELTKSVKIPMQQAIETATREVPGTVLESGLVGQRKMFTKNADGTVTENVIGNANPDYRIVILTGDENNPERHIVLVDAVTGGVVRSVVE